MVLRELVTELVNAARGRRVKSKKRKGALVEKKYKTPRLWPSAI
jgi:hypothetical protein